MNDQTKDSIEKIAEEMQYELLSWVGGVGASTVARWMNQLRALPPSATAQGEDARFGRMLRKIVRAADRNPHQPIGHVIEHLVPEVREEFPFIEQQRGQLSSAEIASGESP